MAVKIAVKGRPEAESFARMPGGNPLAVLVLTNELAGRTEQDAVALAVAVLETAGPVEVVECLEPTRIDDLLDRRDDRPLVVCGGDGSLHNTVPAPAGAESFPRRTTPEGSSDNL